MIIKKLNLKNENLLNKKGFSHFEAVLLIVVVAVIATAGMYVFNYNKNKSNALQVKLDTTDLLFSMPTRNVGGINTKADYYGCIDNRANSSTKGTIMYYGVVSYPGANKRADKPNIQFYSNADLNDGNTPVGAIKDEYDLTYGTQYKYYVTNTYYWLAQNGMRTPYSVFIKDNNDTTIFTGQVDLSKVKTSCPDYVAASADKTKPVPPKKKLPPSPTVTPPASPKTPSPAAVKTIKYPHAYSNFTRVHHLYKKVEDKQGKNLSKASNYDIFWTDSAQKTLIVQYRVNVFPESGLQPGLFYSNIYTAKPRSNDPNYNKSIRITSFEITNPMSKEEYSSPLQKASTATVLNNMKKSTAIEGRYWGEVHITRAQMQGKHILYFNTGYDPSRKTKEPAYNKSQAIDVNNVGWQKKNPANAQLTIRK